MSDADTVEEDALARAIAENPEAVATLVRRLDAVNDLLDVVDLGTAALDDEMVATLAADADLLGEAADGLATRETVHLAETAGASGDDLGAALDTLVRLERSGTLDDLAELAEVVSLATAAADDEMVATLAGTGESLGELADVASKPETVRGLEAMLDAVGEASDAEDPPDPVGAWGLLAATRDPDVKRGLGFLVAVARSLGEGFDAA